jgi:hypothetical protein
MSAAAFQIIDGVPTYNLFIGWRMGAVVPQRSDS